MIGDQNNSVDETKRIRKTGFVRLKKNISLLALKTISLKQNKADGDQKVELVDSF